MSKRLRSGVVRRRATSQDDTLVQDANMENSLEPLSSRRVCRFCLTEEEPLNFIYECEDIKPVQVPLTLRIMSCVDIEVNSADGLPQVICNMCRWYLDRLHKFKLRCKKADEALRDYPLSGELPRPFSPIPNDPPEPSNNRSAESRPQKQNVKNPPTDSSENEQEPANAKQTVKKNFRILKPAEIRVHVCDQCDRTFPLRQALDLHISRSHRDRNYQCGECGRMFFSKYDLNKHMITHSGDKPYSCRVCQKQFSRPNMLQRHEKVHRDEMHYSCQHCDREFFTPEELQKHENAVHKTKKDKPFHCSSCDKRFQYKQSLERHEVIHSDDKTFICEYCNEAFHTSTKLARHLSNHAGHRPYLCKLCPRTFLLSHHLSRHMRSHTVENRHVCEDCGKVFKRKRSFEVHQITHAKNPAMVLTYDVYQESCRNPADYVTYIKEHIEADEEMDPDDLQPDCKVMLDIDTEEVKEGEDPYSDGDDDYQPPTYLKNLQKPLARSSAIYEVEEKKEEEKEEK